MPNDHTAHRDGLPAGVAAAAAVYAAADRLAALEARHQNGAGDPDGARWAAAVGDAIPELLALGVSTRRLSSDEFVRVLPGHYTPRAAPAPLRVIATTVQRRILPSAVIGHVTAAERAPVMIPAQAHLDPRFKLFPNLPEDEYESILAVPIVAREKLEGALNVRTREPRSFTEEEMALLVAIAAQVAQTIEHAKLYEGAQRRVAELEALARISGLADTEIPLVRLPGGPELRNPSTGEVSRALGIGLDLDQAVNAWRAIIGARESWAQIHDLVGEADQAAAQPRTILPPAAGHLRLERVDVIDPVERTPIVIDRIA